MRIGTLLTELFVVAALSLALGSCSGNSTIRPTETLRPAATAATANNLQATVEALRKELEEERAKQATVAPTATPTFAPTSTTPPDNFRPWGIEYRSNGKIGVRHTDDGVLGTVEIEAPENVKAGEYFTLRFRLDSRQAKNPHLFATFAVYPEFDTQVRKTDCKIFFTGRGVEVKEEEYELNAGPFSGVMLKPSS